MTSEMPTKTKSPFVPLCPYLMNCFIHDQTCHFFYLKSNQAKCQTNLEKLLQTDRRMDGQTDTSNVLKYLTLYKLFSQIAKFMGPTWGPPGSCQPQMGQMLAPWTLMSGFISAQTQTLTIVFESLSHYMELSPCTNSDSKFNSQSWWLHQMETFSVLLALCVGNSPVTGEFPSQSPVT